MIADDVMTLPNMPLVMAALCLDTECNTVFQLAMIGDDNGTSTRARLQACPLCGGAEFQMLSTWINREEKKLDDSRP